MRVGAYGVRKQGETPPMHPLDLVHIGSNTKAMTAVLAARLVQQGCLQWESTVGDVLVTIKDAIHPQFRPATLAQLLQHTAGVPRNAANWWAYRNKTMRARRLAIAQDGLRSAPLSPPGAQHRYSNLSVLVAGAMAEAAAGADWETLMRREVFEPLGMKSAGFGVPGAKGGLEQPWGHVEGWLWGLRPVQTDNDPALGPAGTVHLTLSDWSRFLAVFLGHDKIGKSIAGGGGGGFLSEESLRKLLEPGTEGGSYGMGWILAQRSWAGGQALTHSGSNTTWYASSWVAPATGTAYLVAINAYNKHVPAAANSFITAAVTHSGADKLSQEGGS